jgi:hypothetical protein
MSLFALPLLPLLAPFQDAQQPPPGDPASPWKPVDWVEVQVGDEMITWLDVQARTDEIITKRKLSVTTKADHSRLDAQTLDQLVLMALESQAAEDHEENTEEAEDKVNRFLAARRKEAGLVDYQEQLEASGMSAFSEHDRTMSDYWASTFRSQGLHGPRPTRDGYVRPGERGELYRIRGSSLGGDPTVRFQDLLVTVDQVGGIDQAHDLAEELRQRLLAGEDFKALHDEYGTTELATNGVTRLFGPDNPLPDPILRRFADENDVGAISPVYPVRDSRRSNAIVGFRVLRIYERSPGTPPPPYEEAETQEKLSNEASKTREEIFLGMARAKLAETAFLWSNDPGAPAAAETAGGPAPAASPR